jgi:hypothetical protein
VLIELLAWAGVVVVSERKSPLLASSLVRFEGFLDAVGRRRLLAVAGIFLVVFFGRLALLPIYPVPPPKIQDEFSQLLSADTFASGRVTNPTHPMSFYFETFFVNQKPTYHSMYPPAPGLFMAGSQILTGNPWPGMLFAFAAASAAMCWMLQGWMPSRYAPWGAIAFVLLSSRLHITEDYLGEGIVMLGGALIVGAIPRIVKRRSSSASLWLGVGIALLATSRPFEGALLTSGICLGGVYWAKQAGWKWGSIFKTAVLPVALILLPTFAFMGYQNWRTTGNVGMAPYKLNLIQQHITRPFIWQKPVDPPKLDHVAMVSFYNQWESHWWKISREFPRGTFLFIADKLCTEYAVVVWPFTFVLAMSSFQLFKSKTRRFLPLTFFVFLFGLSLETYQLQYRYIEPACGLGILIAVYGMRYLRVWRRSNRTGLKISRAALVGIPLVLIMVNVFMYGPHKQARSERWYSARAQITRAMESLSGKQLILVRYSPSHFPQEEWVYNRADIDNAKVVWARDDADRAEVELPRYFSDRTVWILDPDSASPVITSLPELNATAVSEIGPFRVSCSNLGCEDLKHSLESVLNIKSNTSIAENAR